MPHYVAAAPNPKVALALVRAFEGDRRRGGGRGELESAAEDYERQVTAAVASDPEVKAFVERLETALDEVTAETRPTRSELPSADTIAQRLPALPAPARAGGPGQGLASLPRPRLGGHRSLHDNWWLDIPDRGWRDPEVRG